MGPPFFHCYNHPISLPEKQRPDHQVMMPELEDYLSRTIMTRFSWLLLQLMGHKRHLLYLEQRLYTDGLKYNKHLLLFISDEERPRTNNLQYLF